jgi:hypothetical protein
MEGLMCSSRLAHSSFLIALTIVSVVAFAACGDAPPASDSEQSTAPDQTPTGSGERATTSTALAGASPAPGSERLDPDPHPELAHLAEVTTDSLSRSITDYVQAESAKHGGVFPVNDPEQQTELALTLSTVHRERLSQLADGRYFACADFKGRDGRTYDVDIFMRRESTGLTPTEVIVHKQDGRPRFDWVERNGVWSQQPVAGR